MSTSNSQSDMQTVQSKRNKRATPSRQDRSSTAASPGTANVYFHEGSETVFVGNINNETTFADYSRAARRQLMRYNPRTKQNVLITKAS